MINLSEKELNYCLSTFKKILSDMDNYKMNDYYRIHLDSIDEDLLNKAKELLDMKLNIDKVNNNPEINDKFIDTIYWIDAMWVWLEAGCTAEDIREIISEECYSIYQKIIGKNFIPG